MNLYDAITLFLFSTLKTSMQTNAGETLKIVINDSSLFLSEFISVDIFLSCCAKLSFIGSKPLVKYPYCRIN